MKLIGFSRDSEIEVVINPSVPGTYDVSFAQEDGINIECGLSAGDAWLQIRTSGLKVPAKLMLDFAELAIASLLKSKPVYLDKYVNLTLKPEVTDAE